MMSEEWNSRIWPRQDSGIKTCTKDTAKIRTLKLFSIYSKNGGCLDMSCVCKKTLHLASRQHVNHLGFGKGWN